MKKSTKNKVELPLTLADIQLELEVMASEVLLLAKSGAASIKEIIKCNFDSADGCMKCLGRGWVVVWDTMDSATGCYAEYGKCPNVACTEESRAASGLYPSYSKYDGIKCVNDPVSQHPAYNVLVMPFNTQYIEISRNIRELASDRATFHKGDSVVVVKGRKVPIGTVGNIAWISVDTGGILVKPADSWQDRAADGIWVNKNNLEKVKV